MVLHLQIGIGMENHGGQTLQRIVKRIRDVPQCLESNHDVNWGMQCHGQVFHESSSLSLNMGCDVWESKRRDGGNLFAG
jgi:hypothetical protein